MPLRHPLDTSCMNGDMPAGLRGLLDFHTYCQGVSTPVNLGSALRGKPENFRPAVYPHPSRQNFQVRVNLEFWSAQSQTLQGPYGFHILNSITRQTKRQSEAVLWRRTTWWNRCMALPNKTSNAPSSQKTSHIQWTGDFQQEAIWSLWEHTWDRLNVLQVAPVSQEWTQTVPDHGLLSPQEQQVLLTIFKRAVLNRTRANCNHHQSVCVSVCVCTWWVAGGGVTQHAEN